MSDAAVPHILLVDGKFHQLNRELKAFRSPSSSKVKWEEKREEMRVHLEEFIEDIVPAANITNYSLNELPRGRLDRKTALLGAYRRGKLEDLDGHGYQKFGAGRHIKSRLVCYWCVKTWLKKSRNVSDEDWKERTTKSFLHVFGRSRETQSSNLSLNRQLYAVHPQKKSNDNGGSKCKGASTVPQSGTPALAITMRDDGSLAPNYRILVHNVPDDRFYNPIRRELTTIDDHCLGDNAATFTNKFQNNYDGFVDLSTVPNTRSLEQCLNIDTTRFQHADVVILEGLASRRSPTIDVMYLPTKFSGTHAFSFTDSINPLSDGLGLFLFVKSNITHELDPFFKHLSASRLSSAISDGLRWTRPGKLYRFRPEMFHDQNEDGSTTSAIDLADWLSSSSVLKEIRTTNPHSELPTIRTTLRSISIYSLTEREPTGFELHALKNQSKTSGHKDAYLFKLGGFRLGTTTGSLKLFSVDDDGRPIWFADLSERDFSKGYIILKLPKNLEYSTRMELNLWATDGKFSNEASVQFTRNSQRKNYYAGQDGIEVLDDEAQTREMLNHHLQLKLSETDYVGVSVKKVVDRIFIASKPVYSEILKELMSDKPQEFPLTSRESRLRRSLLGLDMLSFGRQNLEENSFGVRLRSMGLYRPVEDEERKKLWRADGEHIVELSKTWNLLLTNKPLHAYGLSVNDERLIVTNHGTFFKSDETINELSSIPRESKPRYLHHIAPDPPSHLQFLVDLMDCNPAGGDSSEYENLVVSHQLKPTDGGRLLGLPHLTNNAGKYHLQRISGELSSVLETKRSFYLTHQAGDGPLTCLDVVFARNQNGTNQALILRRHHQSGQIDALNLGRWLDDGRGNMVPHRPAWWARLPELEQQHPLLKGIFETLGAQHETPNRVRSHDWHFMVRDTLRAFHLLSGQFPKPQINTLSELRSAYSYHWPEPLRKYLMGGGRYFGAPEHRNGDALGGLLDDLDELREPGLKRAIIGAVLRWTWCPRG